MDISNANPGQNMPTVLVFVGHYLPGYKAGGILRSVSNMVDHLSNAFRFLIVTRDRDLGDKVAYAQSGPDWQQVATARVRYLRPADETVDLLAGLLNATPHDVLYLNSFFEPLTIRALANRLRGRTPDRPVVLAPRGEFAWASLRLRFPKKQAFMWAARMAGLYRKIIWHASGEEEAADIARWMRVPRDRIRLAMDLPSLGLSTAAEASPRWEEGRGERLKIVFLSRISPEKNLDFALRVLARVSRPVAFDIVGPVEDAGYWSECESLIAKLPAHVECKARGGVASSSVLQTLSGYDVLFFPSGGESYGHVIGEAVSVGTSVLISTRTPWRGMEEKGLGWDVPLESAEEFARIIDRMADEDPDARAERRRQVQARAQTHLASTERREAHAALFHGAIRDFSNKTTVRPGTSTLAEARR